MDRLRPRDRRSCVKCARVKRVRAPAADAGHSTEVWLKPWRFLQDAGSAGALNHFAVLAHRAAGRNANNSAFVKCALASPEYTASSP